MCESNKAKRDTFYSKLFARFYDPFMADMERKVLIPRRKKLISELTGDILEVGSGTGINFPLYHQDAWVIASEPSGEMLGYARQRMETEEVKANIDLVQAGVGDKELEQRIPDKGLDAIVCTLVLCTIPEPEEALKDMVKWLKPEGKLIILEHIHAKKNPGKMVHNLLNPFWNRFAEGCNLNRNTDQLLKDMGFKPEWETYYHKVLPFYLAIMKYQR